MPVAWRIAAAAAPHPPPLTPPPFTPPPFTPPPFTPTPTHPPPHQRDKDSNKGEGMGFMFSCFRCWGASAETPEEPAATAERHVSALGGGASL